MPRSVFNALVTEKTLALLNQRSMLADAVLSSSQTEEMPIPEGLTPEQVKELEAFRDQIKVPTKNVCAKVSPQLAKRIDDVADLLGISKRRFLEAAFVDAIDRALSIMKEEGFMTEDGSYEEVALVVDPAFDKDQEAA